MIHDLTCSGPHVGGTETLGAVDLPAGLSPDRIAAALTGYLCPDCGDVYRHAVSFRGHEPGIPPSVDLVNDLLPTLRPSGYVPRFPPGPPSWAPKGKPWPYPGRPDNVPAPN